MKKIPKFEKNITFVAFIISPFHLLGVIAFCLKNSVDPSSGYLFVLPHPNGNYLIDHDLPKKVGFSNIHYLGKIGKCNINNLFLGISYTIKNEKLKSEDDEILWVLAPRDFPLSFFCKINSSDLGYRRVAFVLVDEGIGSYIGFFGRLLARVDEQKDFGKVFFNSLLDILRRIFQVYLNLSGIKITNFFLFRRYRNKLLPSLEFGPYYKKAINTSIFLEKSSLKTWLIRMRSLNGVLLVTQPFVEIGQIDEETYLAILDEVLKYLVSKYDVVLLKLHPKEDLFKYKSFLERYGNISIIPESKIPVESVLKYVRFDVAGFNSTSLVTASLFFNLSALSFAPLIARYVKKKSVRYLFKLYENIFNDWIEFVDIKNVTS